jgi:hypothetical protein
VGEGSGASQESSGLVASGAEPQDSGGPTLEALLKNSQAKEGRHCSFHPARKDSSCAKDVQKFRKLGKSYNNEL